MTIPLAFSTRYAIPLVVAAIYLGNVNFLEQFQAFDKTQRLADRVLSEARHEGQDENGAPESFDYIIVGGGSAGALLANRLSQSGKDHVLLLEAGGDSHPLMDIPRAQINYFAPNPMDWGYSTVKQTGSCGNTGGHCMWLKGKVLGGSSSINGLLYNRCKPQDYNRWAEFTGDESWSWDNIKTTFNSFENYHGFYENTSGGGHHGKGGEMYVGKIDFIPGVELMEKAIAEKGIPLGDLNAGPEMTYGFSKIDYNIKQGFRWGTYQAFLEPILNRKNLVIYRYAYVYRVDTVHRHGLRQAIGVTYKRHGTVYNARAKKEVILSAGAIESPKLLMLSGIGPKNHLKELGIPTLVDLPVGKYLQDQPGVQVLGKNGGFRVNAKFGSDWNTPEAVLQFIQNGTGPFNGFLYNTDPAYTTEILMGYLNSKINFDKTRPDVHVYVLSKFYKEDNKIWGNERERDQFYFYVELVNVTSTGSVKLSSADPDKLPVIDPNFLQNSEEVDVMIDGIEIMLDIFLNSTTFRNLDIQPFEPQEDHCSTEHKFLSREYWRCYIHHYSMPFFHTTSTCRMGPNSSVAVVDSKLKVYGTKNLRVVDASVMPFVPRGNTNLPTMLIAARAAEIILSGSD